MRKFGLIGYPLSHSFSVGFFADKFAKEGIIDAEYQNYPIDCIDKFPELLASNPNLCGLNVTIPYKEKVISFLDDMDETAKAVEAVNTIKFYREKNTLFLKGFNTDVFGFEESLKKFLRPVHKRALLLGTGGASKAVNYVLKKLNFEIDVVSRTFAPGIFKTYNDLTLADIATHQLIVNTSPVGMYPNINQFPEIPYEGISSKHLLYDLIYNPRETAFLQKGREQGANILNGLEMLHLQALKSWEIWNE